jgi:hypothetical protein
VAVTDIDNVSSGGARNVESDLSGAVVHPTDATHKDIVWSVKEAGGTGVANIVDNKFTPAAAGTLVLTATIANGSAEGTPYTKDFTIVIDANITPVTNITGIPTAGIVNELVDLSGATIVPSNASFQSIVWSVKTAGAGITSITGTSFTPTAVGTVTLTATIANGVASGTPYTKDFAIAVDVRPVTGINFPSSGTGLTSITPSGTTSTANGKAGTEIDLSNAAATPGNATNTSIAWSVTSDGTTGAPTGAMSGNKVTPTAAGTLVITGTVAGGAAGGTAYTHTLTITVVFVPVTDFIFPGSGTGLTDIATDGTDAHKANGANGTEIDLSNVTVFPTDATKKDIEWSVDTNVAGISVTGLDTTGKFTPDKAGTLVLTGTVENGKTNGTADYEHTLTITIP